MNKKQSDLLQIMNTVASSAILLYAVHTENRIATLEAKMNLLLQNANIVFIEPKKSN